MIVFTEKQKGEVKNIKEISKDVLQELLNDKKCIENISEILAEQVSQNLWQKIDEFPTKNY